MNFFKLDLEVYIWKRYLELFILDDKCLIIVDIIELIRYLMFWNIYCLFIMKRIFSLYLKVVFYFLVVFF